MKLEDKLKQSGHSVTKSRVQLFKILKSQKQPLSTSEVISECKDFDRATVYRTIELFEELGVIKRVWFGFKSKIELSEQFEEHHHHIICKDCGQIKNIDHSQLELMIKTISNKAGYTPTDHHIEIIGKCQKCRQKYV